MRTLSNTHSLNLRGRANFIWPSQSCKDVPQGLAHFFLKKKSEGFLFCVCVCVCVPLALPASSYATTAGVHLCSDVKKTTSSIWSNTYSILSVWRHNFYDTFGRSVFDFYYIRKDRKTIKGALYKLLNLSQQIEKTLELDQTKDIYIFFEIIFVLYFHSWTPTHHLTSPSFDNLFTINNKPWVSKTWLFYYIICSFAC